MDLIVGIPSLPPGINSTYGISTKKHRIYKKQTAKKWEKDFGLLVRNKIALLDWREVEPEYRLIIIWWGSKHDADAHVKLAQDALTRACDFDDKKISQVEVYKVDPQSGPFYFPDEEYSRKALYAILTKPISEDEIKCRYTIERKV